MLGTDDTAADNAATSLLYASEQYDSALGQYYLRARYYNPYNGTFNRMDPFAGSQQDPQSLHKYLYCHNNPVNFTDPDGYMAISMGSLITRVIIYSIIIAVMVTLVYSIQRAITTRGATQREIRIVNQAIVQAQILVQDALSKLNRMNTADRSEYTMWFGVHSNARRQRVVDCYTKVQTHLNTGFGWSVTNKNVFGIKGIFGHISFGNLFWTAPANAGTGVPDTQPGTIIHELTHKARMTKDHEYGVFDCKRLANTKPDKAVRNADNYEYFAEVVP